MKKKLLLGLGSAITITTPVISVISCGEKQKIQTPIKSLARVVSRYEDVYKSTKTFSELETLVVNQSNSPLDPISLGIDLSSVHIGDETKAAYLGKIENNSIKVQIQITEPDTNVKNNIRVVNVQPHS